MSLEGASVEVLVGDGLFVALTVEPGRAREDFGGVLQSHRRAPPQRNAPSHLMTLSIDHPTNQRINEWRIGGLKDKRHEPIKRRNTIRRDMKGVGNESINR